MKFRNKLLFSLFILTAIAPSSYYALETAPSSTIEASLSWKEVVVYAREHLPLDGQLLQKEDGFVYLKVDDEYIHSLFPMLGLSDEGYREPPYFRSKEATGAHISVIYEDENTSPEELGQTFHFELQDIVIVQASKTALYAVLQVYSPELENLRKKYGLSPKLHGYEFHISLAKRTSKKR